MIFIFPGAQFPVLTQFIRRCLDILKYNGERLGAGIEERTFQFLLHLLNYLQCNLVGGLKGEPQGDL